MIGLEVWLIYKATIKDFSILTHHAVKISTVLVNFWDEKSDPNTKEDSFKLRTWPIQGVESVSKVLKKPCHRDDPDDKGLRAGPFWSRSPFVYLFSVLEISPKALLGELSTTELHSSSGYLKTRSEQTSKSSSNSVFLPSYSKHWVDKYSSIPSGYSCVGTCF